MNADRFVIERLSPLTLCDEDVHDIECLLRVLSTRDVPPVTQDDVARVVASPTNVVVVARDTDMPRGELHMGKIVAMGKLAYVDNWRARRGHYDDVVALRDPEYKGLGKRVVRRLRKLGQIGLGIDYAELLAKNDKLIEHWKQSTESTGSRFEIVEGTLCRSYFEGSTEEN